MKSAAFNVGGRTVLQVDVVDVQKTEFFHHPHKFIDMFLFIFKVKILIDRFKHIAKKKTSKHFIKTKKGCNIVHPYSQKTVLVLQ